MDIRQLKYFVEIVNSDFNLTVASGKLNISQPALSMFIKKFEQDEKVDVFIRYKGLIKGLSTIGETFYNNAVNVVNQYEHMIDELRLQTSHLNGILRIGIPQLIVTVVCTRFLNLLVQKYEHVKFLVNENGAYDLEKELLLNGIDCAVLLRPTSLSPTQFREVLISKDELSVFMNKSHPLAGKERLTWRDLEGQRLVIFDESYMIHHKLKQKLEEYQVNPQIAMMSKSWDFLLESVRYSDSLTILPSPISRFYNLGDVREIRFDDPIEWEVVFVYPIKRFYSRIELTMQSEINNYYLEPKRKARKGSGSSAAGSADAPL